jgi:hypothetical protein
VKRPDQIGQPVRSSEQRLTSVQDDVDVGQCVALGVLGDALDGQAGD